MDRIHVCYAIYDKKGTFSKYTGTSMTSMLENTDSPVTLHLLHDATLTEDNREKFEVLAAKYGQKIFFYDMETLCGEVLSGILEILPDAILTRFSQAALYRLLAGIVLPQSVHKLIYLDADTIVHMDIARLWNEEVGENGLAAIDEISATQGNPAPQPLVEAGEISRDRYFNSGVMLIDLDKWREYPEFLTNGLKMLTEHPKCFCFDQDILNYAFASNYRKLSGDYDVFVSMDRFLKHKIRPAIYHYAGKVLDLFDIQDEHNRLYALYFAKSPWCSIEVILRLFGNTYKILDDSRVRAREYFSTAAGKRRVFCGSKVMWEQVNKCFAPKEGEEYKVIIDEEGNLAVHPLVNMMKKNQGALFVFFTDMYDRLKPHFKQAGFEEMLDYVDGFQLMKEQEGGRKLWGGDLFDSM
ncbi:MAG: glycosyltransferase family 8 protein [Schwartzia succinivorans]|nr:glycosyltransferase family 8 protein [Schwartzia succinivorans]